MQALIYKSTGSWYTAKTEAGEMVQARIKGKFKIDGITSTNPIAVGDIVEIEREKDQTIEHSYSIVEIYERRNYINRISPHKKYKHHIVAANLDQSLLFATIKEPRTSQGFIDRFLITSEAYHIPSIIVFNKADLYRQKEMSTYEEWKVMYEEAGYQVFLVSMETMQGVEEVKGILKDKITLISGHSGVGKSTFINYLLPQLDLRTEEVSSWSGKGMHTTTFAEMYDLPFGGSIIDTPGVKEFGLVDISKQELSHYFPEMRALINECQFNNCLHLEEPGCAIKAAVENETLHPLRYISYAGILATIEEKKY
ncbi:MAG: ribosome small subunit-dependent GTPase A [Chitinophagaceae bacterium]|nr:ribosome small subunit-dependent GTPase A [Chitinophagaceae bacterium]